MKQVHALCLVCGILCYAGARSAGAQDVTWSPARALNPTAASDSRRDDGAVALETDRKGNWVAVWGSNASTGLDYETYAARSDNNGTTWTGLTAVNSDAAVAGDGQDDTQHLATDGNGTWVAVWMKNIALGTGTDNDIFFARSTNNGTTWTTLAPIDSTATTDTLIDVYPSIAADGAGTFVATWGSVDPATNKYYMKSSRSTDKGITWEPVQLVYPGEFYTGPSNNTCFKLDTDGHGVWTVIGHSTRVTSNTTSTDFDIVSFRSTDDGKTWSAPIVVNNEATSDSRTQQYPNIASDGKNTWVAAWSDHISTGVSAIKLARSLDGGITWSDAVNVSSGQAPYDAAPIVESDDHGSWIVGWETGSRKFEHSISRDNGATWTNNGYINNTNYTNESEATPYITSDKHGRWIAAWSSSTFVSGNGGGDDEIHYSIAEFGNPSVEISSGTLDFGTHVVDAGATGTLEVVLTNTGIGAIQFEADGIRITGPSANAFAFVEPPSLEPLPQDESRLIKVNFDPTQIGAHLALLRIYSTAPESPMFIDLQGWGEAAPSAVRDWSVY